MTGEYRFFAPAVRITRPNPLAVALLLLSLLGCQNHDPDPARIGLGSAGDPLRVVATIFPLADLARSLGGSEVSVVTLLPPGANPHSFEFRPGDVRALRDASIVLGVGGSFEPWVDRALIASPVPNRIVLRGVDHVKTIPLVFADVHEEMSEQGSRNVDGGHAGDQEPATGIDPHFWLDPHRMAELAPHVTATFTRLRPDREALFRAALEAVQDSLARVDREVAARLEPVRGVRLLALHASWGYFADRYGLRIEGVLETFPGQEPGPVTVAAIDRRARSEGVRAIVAEPQQSVRLASVLAEDLGIPMLLLDPLGGEGIQGRETYPALLRWNASELARALAK